MCYSFSYLKDLLILLEFMNISDILSVFCMSDTVMSVLPLLSHLIHYSTWYVPLFSFYSLENLRLREIKWPKSDWNPGQSVKSLYT